MRFDPDMTKRVIDLIGPKCSPRNREILSCLIQHIHDFARETELSMDEWMLGVHFVNSIGQASHAARNEGQRVCDVIGLESVVHEIASKTLGRSSLPTSSTLSGPFWSPNAPCRPLGASVIDDPAPGGQTTFMHGKVTDLNNNVIPNALVDFWQASSNGLYDFQDPDNQRPNNLRGKFRTNEQGEYWFYCLKPVSYSLPIEGPAYVLLNVMDRHPMRPAHIHLMISHDSYQMVTTQIFPSDDKYIDTDTVFAVKEDLIVDFLPREGDANAVLDLLFDVRLALRN